MFCSKHWSRSFIAEVMPKSYMVGEYKRHREDIVFDHEQSTLVAMAPYVQAKKRIKYYREELPNIEKQIEDLTRKRRIMLSAKERNMDFYKGRTQRDPNQSAMSTDPEKSYTTRGHCTKENCNGFIGEGWTCCVCDTKVCSKCMVEKVDGHICDPIVVATVQQIRKDSKPCPSCRVRVFRIAGCSQMWCTNCNTAFCWNTLSIIDTRHFHNPHYAEWVSRNGNNTRTAAPTCGEVIGHHNITDACTERFGSRWDLHGAFRYPEGYKEAYDKFATLLSHLNDRVATYTYNGRQHEQNRRDLKVNYLLGEIDKDTFKVQVQRMDKRNSLKLEIWQFVEMYTRVTKDLIASWCRKEIDMDGFDSQYTELHTFCTKSLEDVKTWYACSKKAYNDILVDMSNMGNMCSDCRAISRKCHKKCSRCTKPVCRRILFPRGICRDCYYNR